MLYAERSRRVSRSFVSMMCSQDTRIFKRVLEDSLLDSGENKANV